MHMKISCYILQIVGLVKPGILAQTVAICVGLSYVVSSSNLLTDHSVGVGVEKKMMQFIICTVKIYCLLFYLVKFQKAKKIVLILFYLRASPR